MTVLSTSSASSFRRSTHTTLLRKYCGESARSSLIRSTSVTVNLLRSFEGMCTLRESRIAWAEGSGPLCPARFFVACVMMPLSHHSKNTSTKNVTTRAAMICSSSTPNAAGSPLDTSISKS